MQAAFVEAGLERAAFIHASDINPGTGARSENIADLVQDGSEVIVQVVKDPIGSKGARLTTNISIPSRFMVYMPNMQNVGVSQKIEAEGERFRLREILNQYAEAANFNGGFIARTAAEAADEFALRADMQFLHRLWESIGQKAEQAVAKELIHEDLPLALRALRDLVGPEVEKVRIDSRSAWKKAVHFAEQFIPEMTARIEYYPGERPVFRPVRGGGRDPEGPGAQGGLEVGGHLVIDQTEAMTTIDVNTGAFVGHRNLEETIFKTNLEAAQAICRQLRLRNLGGIIIIDFIDMLDEEHKRQVMRALERCLARDHAKTHISEVSSLGLVEMTRKRIRESLEHVLCVPCPTCSGRGFIKTAETACYEIFREILRESRQFDVESLLVLASQEVVDRMVDEESQNLAELEQFIGKPIKLQAEALYTQEQFDVVLI